MTDLSKLKAEVEQVQRPKTDLGGVLLGRQADGTEDDGREAMLNCFFVLHNSRFQQILFIFKLELQADLYQYLIRGDWRLNNRMRN